MGRGSGQVVSVLAFYSDDPSSNHAEAYGFFCNIVFEKNENKQKKRPGLAHFFKDWLMNFLPLIDFIILQSQLLINHISLKQ